MIVLDTNVVSELMRASPAPAVRDWVRGRQELRVTTSITVAELQYGIEIHPPGRRKEDLRRKASEVLDAIARQVLVFDALAAHQFALIVSDRERIGRPIDGFDAQIAAICRVNHAAVATRNIKDFEGTGVRLVDPWS